MKPVIISLQRLAAVCLLCCLQTAAVAASREPVVPIPDGAAILSRLRKDHPRLLATTEDFARLKQRVNADATLKSWHAKLQGQGVRILREPPSKYEIPDGLRLLSTSRRVVQRVQTLALLYQLEGDPRFVDRAWQELQTAAQFKDWNPRHFLDTAEMTHGFAIGYDWLFDRWTPQQRAVLREAMIEKGIKLANDIHSKNTWWAKAHHNWNQVCNGGIGLGALAVGDEAAEVAGEFLQAALKSIQLPMAEFAPDGAWAEGPGYWAYATSYNVVFLAALESALGTDFGLAQIPGFAEAGLFPIYATGPTGDSFNYADAHAGAIRAPQMFWFARKFNRPAYAAYARQLASPHPLDLLWYDAALLARKPAPLPLDKYFRNSEVAMLRSAWDDRNALFVGLKAGDNKANHSNLDLGSFICEALGVRWAVDLGADDYNMPGYFGNRRWTYYRMRPEGHNTLVINPSEEPGQNPAAAAKLMRFESNPGGAIAITDLTPAYAALAGKVQRGLALLGRQQVLVQDEVQTAQPSELWWFLHTEANASVSRDGRSATLKEGSEQLVARILSPANASFSIMDAKPLPTSPQPDRQNKNRGVRKLAIQLKDVTDTRLAVLLTPVVEGSNPPVPHLQPLADWAAH